MKTRTIKTQKIFETVLFCCEKCDFETPYDFEIKYHTAEIHAPKQKKVVGGEVFYRFDEKEAAEFFLKNCRGGWRLSAVNEFDWRGAGWYTYKEFEDYNEREYKQLLPVAAVIKQKEEKMEELTQQIEKLFLEAEELEELQKELPP